MFGIHQLLWEVDRYWSERVMYKTDGGWEMKSFVRGSWSSQALSRVEPTSGEVVEYILSYRGL